MRYAGRHAQRQTAHRDAFLFDCVKEEEEEGRPCSEARMYSAQIGKSLVSGTLISSVILLSTTSGMFFSKYARKSPSEHIRSPAMESGAAVLGMQPALSNLLGTGFCLLPSSECRYHTGNFPRTSEYSAEKRS
jgi:hypothetical protein